MKTEILKPGKAAFEDYLNKALDFETYMDQLTEATDKVKNGETEGITYPQYLPINLQRLKRGLKQIKLSEELSAKINAIEHEMTWLVLTEHWCGDAAQSLALLHKITEASNHKIKLKLVFRDEHPELMDAFLTNGSKSIPKLIQLDEQLEVTDEWGPRPAPAQELVMEKLGKGESYNDDLHRWYARDKAVTLQEEITALLKD